MKRILLFILVIALAASIICGCTDAQIEDELTTPLPIAAEDKTENTNTSIDDIISEMSLNDKAAQMVQGVMYSVTPQDIKKYGLGSVLSGGSDIPARGTLNDWNQMISAYQDAALSRDIQIPIIYGIDSVHGHTHVYNPIIFPHNIGLGAANDPELMAEMGKIVAEEMKATSIHWNFGPCVACALDPRWGRTYESISTDPNLTTELLAPVAKAFQDNGIAACAKHYIGDGGTTYGTSQIYAIDQGNVIMTEDELRDAFMQPYKQLIDDGVYTVMVSFSSFNGLKMHQHEYLITDVLKDELGFEGLVISDWEGHKQINASTYNEQVAIAINSGIDMLMEPYEWKNAIDAIVADVENGSISMERIDDAVYRILWVKNKLGLFDNAYTNTDYEIRSKENLQVALELVEKSCVLLKNKNDLLPIADNTKVFVTGPALDNIGIQCGGWTKTWQGTMDKTAKVTEGTTLLEGLKSLAENKNIEIITDVNRINEADMVLIAVGEIPYAEGIGDSADISLTCETALEGNTEAISLAKSSNLPTITVIIAGRNVMISDYIDDWDAVVMAYLPGTEGHGVANVLMGKTKFTGKLAMPWYKSVNDIGTDNPELLFDIGYGLSD